MQITKLNPASYSHIQSNGLANNTRETKPDDSHGLWREDLQQQLSDARQQVREFTAPLMVQAYQAQHIERLISAYTGQGESSQPFDQAIKSQQQLQRHVRNTVLLQAYHDEHAKPSIGERVEIAA